jgi:spore germination cell wall hydrolase CwlJ-like protein
LHFALSIFSTPALLTGCVQGGATDALTTASVSRTAHAYSPKEQECLERAIFFEANRSSREGMLAVGSVVMNRMESGRYPSSICGVVGQKGQFAPGVLSRPMDSNALPEVKAAAADVLAGKRHPKIENAMFFHMAGLKFPYKNMHYVLVAGGNAFYEKR